jgi:hypothetical protein
MQRRLQATMPVEKGKGESVSAGFVPLPRRVIQILRQNIGIALGLRFLVFILALPGQAGTG